MNGQIVAEMTVQITPENRDAVELIYDMCLKCVRRRRDCTCHDEGKGDD